MASSRKKAMKIKILPIIVLCLVYGAGYLSSELHKSEAPAHDWGEAPTINEAEPYEVWLPTIRELQTIVGCKKIDGKVGDSWRTSETQQKWTEYTNNYNGVKVCIEAGMR